ncbi:MAG: aminodeoxychorismate synthase component 1 [Gammaproteobacteria bacterium]
MEIIPLTYPYDSSRWVTCLRDLPGLCFLDSSWPYCQKGRYDIISACPSITLHTDQLCTYVSHTNTAVYPNVDPLSIMQRYLSLEKTITPPPNAPPLPFYGGAIGYWGYDLAPYFDTVPRHQNNDINLPDMMVGIYDWAIIVDHQQQTAYLVAAHYDPQTSEIIKQVSARLTQFNTSSNSKDINLNIHFQAEQSFQHYNQAFQRIMNYLHAGDCYQVNLAQRFSAHYRQDSWQAYCYFRKRNPAPFAGFMQLQHGAVLSCSPERFLQVNAQGEVETKPIKGTRPRDINPLRDQQLATELLNSEKDFAENLMIVDLMRNDISRCCQVGSVQVPNLCALESFQTVHHLVSTVQGTLVSNQSAIDLLRACFPGGSITGAPKIRAMQIINELEPVARKIYCGSLGYISYHGHMDTNIAIRTLMHADDQLYCYSGGGIVADSELTAEYQETLDKAAAFLTARA